MSDLSWHRLGHDHGPALERDLGYSAIYPRYNSGLHVSTNGRLLAGLLEALTALWPVHIEHLAIVSHSMGGLVSRSACHAAAAAGHSWPVLLHKMIFLGTPHHGTHLEQRGNWVDVALGISRYSAPFARLGKIRSAGVTDLRFGNLLDEDWQNRDRFAWGSDRRRPVPLPSDVDCYAILAGRPAQPDSETSQPSFRPRQGIAADLSSSIALERRLRPRKGCGRCSDGLWHTPALLARRLRERGPSSSRGAPRLAPLRAASRRLGTPVEQDGCARPGTVGDPRTALVVGYPNHFRWLVMVVENREPLVTRSVRLAKAKVAGSKPVFRSTPQTRLR